MHTTIKLTSWCLCHVLDSSASFNSFTPLSILKMTSFLSIHLFIFILNFQHVSKKEQSEIIRSLLSRSSQRKPQEERKQMMLTSDRVTGQPGIGQWWFTMSAMSLLKNAYKCAPVGHSLSSLIQNDRGRKGFQISIIFQVHNFYTLPFHNSPLGTQTKPGKPKIRVRRGQSPDCFRRGSQALDFCWRLLLS